MKNLLFLLGALFLLIPHAVFSQGGGEFGDFEAPLPGLEGNENIDAFVGDGTNNPLTRYINIVIQFITGGIVVIALISMVVGGYIYMTAGGSAERVGTAKSYISAALLGIVLALTAYLILNTINPDLASELQDPKKPAGQQDN